MSSFEILVDVDEVIGDFQTPVLKIMSEVTGRSYQVADMMEWDIFAALSSSELKAVFDQMSRPGFADSLQPTEGSQEFIRRARKLGNVYIVTSPFHSPTWVSDRSRWLWRHFEVGHRNVVNTHAKYLVHGNVLLDDKPEHVTNWLSRRPNELGLLWHIPNTRNAVHGGTRVHNWDAALELIEAHREKRVVR